MKKKVKHVLHITAGHIHPFNGISTVRVIWLLTFMFVFNILHFTTELTTCT